LYLNHLIRRYSTKAKTDPCKDIDPLDQRNWANLEWINRENEKEDLDYQPEIVFDPTTPEDLCIAKETVEFIHKRYYAWIPKETRNDGAAFMRAYKAMGSDMSEPQTVLVERGV
jgi:hypothetical protein